jgi:hypothetical protein
MKGTLPVFTGEGGRQFGVLTLVPVQGDPPFLIDR